MIIDLLSKGYIPPLQDERHDSRKVPPPLDAVKYTRIVTIPCADGAPQLIACGEAVLLVEWFDQKPATDASQVSALWVAQNAAREALEAEEKKKIYTCACGWTCEREQASKFCPECGAVVTL